jgi:hypothetical protein
MMPRLCPTSVIEQRITLGTKERKELDRVIDAYNRDKWLENIPNILIGIAAPIAAVGAGYGLYKIAQGIAAIGTALGGPADIVKGWIDDYERGWDYLSSPGTWRLMAMLKFPGSISPSPSQLETEDHLHYQQFPTNDPQPWTVMGLTYEGWVAQGMPMETWVDWVLHHQPDPPSNQNTTQYTVPTEDSSGNTPSSWRDWV